ncbi:MAG: PKD domain-containing protein [Bacteroidia bacterium]|nr:PKD domain-containing protein [Bacteroidia bacterium]
MYNYSNTKLLKILLFLIFCTQASWAQYCTPLGDCSDEDFIDNFSFYNISNLNSGGSNCYSGSYINTGLSATVYKGSKYGLTIQAGPSWDQGFAIWIDYNQDQDFDDVGEYVYASPYASTSTFYDSITISTSALTGTTRMRVRSAYSTVLSDYQSCDSVTYGETEDYSLTIENNTAPPVADFYSNATLSCNGIVEFYDNSTNSPTQWFWDLGDGSTASVQNPSYTYSADGSYTITLIATNTYGSDTITKTDYIVVNVGGGPQTASCISSTNDGSLGFGITYFSFGNISFSSGDASEGYQDYSCSQGTNLTEGKYYTMGITVDNPSTHNVRVWIDYNDDAVFDTTNELVVSADAVLNVSESVFIPTGAVLNTPLRMRVSADWSGSPEPTPCVLLEYGQAEDYSVIILPNTDPPTADFSVSDSITCDGNVTFSDASQNVPTSWFWDFGDGTTSSSQSPSHYYGVDSNYTITFVASNAYGSDTLIKVIL